MEKLNELVEQAKFVADWHGSDWSSSLCQDKDGKQAHEVICESRGESVISTGSNSNEASWLCDYLELCSPENILAIAEAFRKLEQRAEAAEIEKSGAQERCKLLFDAKNHWADRARAAEAKLSEMQRQEPVAWCPKTQIELLAKYRMVEADLSSMQRFDEVPLFTRPSPVVSLDELVPESMPAHDKGDAIDATVHWCDGYNACRAAILRRIEGDKNAK